MSEKIEMNEVNKNREGNMTINENLYKINMNFEINKDKILAMNDFNIFAIPICNLILDKKVEPCQKRVKTSLI